MRITRWFPLIVALILGACGDDGTEPETARSEDELQFVRFAATPPLETMQVSFWAVRGDDREAEIRYASADPDEDGEKFLEFKVPGDALLRRPDGTVFAEGDSIRITITVSPDGRFLFDMQPSGLVFDPRNPARLRIRYAEVEGDLNGDGESDSDDEDLELRLRVWRQELPGQPWVPVGTLRVEDLEEIEGTINGFTGFCIAG